MTKKPQLNKKITPKDFKDFYWLKSELTNFCREVGISGQGGKIEITDRIYKYLKTGKVVKTSPTKKRKLLKAITPITLKTILGIEYRTYKEKKDFLQSHTNKKFHFTAHLLNYFKKNTGKKTYNDFINEYHKEQKARKDPNFKTKIAPQFEYNTYIRDFLTDNPNKSKKEAIKYWKIKKSLRGDNKYKKSDLDK